jgi:alpha-galactosidase
VSIVRISSSNLFLAAFAVSVASAADISGTWVSKTENPMMGEVEYVYELKGDASGKITGTQRMPFGDSPIIDGKFNANDFESNVTVKGSIEGDTLRIMPFMPGPRPGPGLVTAPGGGAGRPLGRPPLGRSSVGRSWTGFGILVRPPHLSRGAPTPSYRAPSVDYSALSKVEPPPRRKVPPNALAYLKHLRWVGTSCQSGRLGANKPSIYTVCKPLHSLSPRPGTDILVGSLRVSRSVWRRYN